MNTLIEKRLIKASRSIIVSRARRREKTTYCPNCGAKMDEEEGKQ